MRKVWAAVLTTKLNQKVRPCNNTGEHLDCWKSFYWQQVLTGFVKQMHCPNRCNLGSVSLAPLETKTEQDTCMADVLFQMPIYYFPLQPTFYKHLFSLFLLRLCSMCSQSSWSSFSIFCSYYFTFALSRKYCCNRTQAACWPVDRQNFLYTECRHLSSRISTS